MPFAKCDLQQGTERISTFDFRDYGVICRNVTYHLGTVSISKMTPIISFKFSMKFLFFI